MRLTTAGLLAGIVSIYSGAALAECERPRPDFKIPDGRTSSEQDLAAVQAPLATYADAVRGYMQCLNGEASQKAIGKDEARRAELAKEHEAAHWAAADELKGLVDCYTAQLQSFKDTGGGKEKRPADCSSYLSAASARQHAAGPQVSEVIVEASGHTFEIPGGSWLYYLVRDDEPRDCMRQTAKCLYRAVLVRNDSDQELECKGHISYAGTDSEGNETTRSQALVPGRATYVVVDSLAQQGTNAQIFEASCAPRAPLPPLSTAANCKYQVVQPVAISDYYPQPSREAGEEGPVTVEFTLAGKAGHPTDVRAVASSLYPDLDAAAVKAVGDMIMSSNCPKARYRLKVNFQLTQ